MLLLLSVKIAYQVNYGGNHILQKTQRIVAQSGHLSIKLDSAYSHSNATMTTLPAFYEVNP